MHTPGDDPDLLSDSQSLRTARLLVALDGSESALRALSAAVEHTRATPACLHLLTVRSPPPEEHRALGAAAPKRIELLAAAHDEWVLRQAENRLPPAGVRYTREALEGEPAELIMRRAAELKCAAIFMGTRDSERNRTPGMGSVAARVTQLSTVPVRLVK